MQTMSLTSRRRLASSLAAAVSLVGISASTAAAQSFTDFEISPVFDNSWFDLACAGPPPTDTQCLDPSYQESICGRQQIAAGACTTAVQNAMSTAPTVRWGLPRREDGEYTWADSLTARDTNADFDVGFGASYLSELGQYAAEQRNPALSSWITWKTPTSTKRAAWEANGNRVASCEELAYEGWWTYSRFEDEVARRGSDARAIFDAARASGFGAAGLRTRDGWPVIVGRDTRVVPGVPFPTSNIPKNAYFLFQKTAFDKYPFPETAIPSATGRSHYAGNWAWHLAMDDHFRSWGYGAVLDDILDGEYERQKKFVKLLAKRARVLEALSAEAAATPIMVSTTSVTDYAIGYQPASTFTAVQAESDVTMLSPSLVTSVISASTAATADPTIVLTGGYSGNLGKLYAIDAQISRELERAASWGCLDTTGTSMCDWSPRMFADLVDQMFVKEREEEYQRCLALTGNDFSDASPLGNPAAFELRTADYRASAVLVRMFMNTYDDYIDGLDFAPEPGQPKNPSIGWWRDGSRWLGNNEFGAGYSYTFGFGLVKGEEAGECVVDFKARAAASASATVAGQWLSLLDSDTYGVTSAENKFDVHSHTRLLGMYDLYEPVNRSYTSPEPITPWHISKEWAAHATFWIGPVPVTGEIGIAGSAGVELRAGVTLDRKCYDTPKLHVTGALTATPYVRASAFIGALIGARGLGAGLRTDLQLANISAPLTVTAEVHGSGTNLDQLAANTTATVSVDLGLTVDSLGGSVSGVVETPLKNWSKTIFSWEGKRLVDESWRRSWRFPVGRLITKLGS